MSANTLVSSSVISALDLIMTYWNKRLDVNGAFNEKFQTQERNASDEREGSQRQGQASQAEEYRQGKKGPSWRFRQPQQLVTG
jgi:hypothetical protein